LLNHEGFLESCYSPFYAEIGKNEKITGSFSEYLDGLLREKDERKISEFFNFTYKPLSVLAGAVVKRLNENGKNAESVRVVKSYGNLLKEYAGASFNVLYKTPYAFSKESLYYGGLGFVKYFERMDALLENTNAFLRGVPESEEFKREVFNTVLRLRVNLFVSVNGQEISYMAKKLKDYSLIYKTEYDFPHKALEGLVGEPNDEIKRFFCRNFLKYLTGKVNGEFKKVFERESVKYLDYIRESVTGIINLKRLFNEYKEKDGRIPDFNPDLGAEGLFLMNYAYGRKFKEIVDLIVKEKKTL